MKFKLKHPPVAVNGAKFASDVLIAAREISQVELDYSVQSLVLVDDLIDGFKSAHAPIEAVAATLFGFGAYLGEVMVRHAGMRWLDFDDDARARLGHTFGVVTPDGRLWNPLQGAFTRFEGGGSLYDFYKAAAVRPASPG